MTEVKVTNMSRAPQGIRTLSDGVIYLNPNQSRNLDIKPERLEKYRLNRGFLKIEDITAAIPASARDITPPTPAPVADDPQMAELKAQAGLLGVTYANDITTPDLQKLIDAKLAAPAPVTPTT